MNSSKSLFNPSAYKSKIYFLCILFVGDIVMNSFTQFLSFGNKGVISQYNLEYTAHSASEGYFVFCLQLLIHLLMLFTALSLFWNTFYFQLGMVGMVCSRFKYSFIMIGLYPLCFAAERVIRLIYLDIDKQSGINEISIWYDALYRAFYFLKFLVGLIYYIFIIDAALELGKAKYYRPDILIKI